MLAEDLEKNKQNNHSDTSINSKQLENTMCKAIEPQAGDVV